MVDMTHRANIHVRLRPLELRLAHGRRSPVSLMLMLMIVLVAAIGLEPMTFRL